jgi:hypothetical protein
MNYDPVHAPDKLPIHWIANYPAKGSYIIFTTPVFCGQNETLTDGVKRNSTHQQYKSLVFDGSARKDSAFQKLITRTGD